MIVRQLLRAALDHGVVRLATGDGDVQFPEPFGVPETLDGAEATYRGGADFEGVVDGQVRFTMAADRLRGREPTPLGGRSAVVFYVASADGSTWDPLPFVTRALLDSPVLEGGRFSVGLTPPRWDEAPAQWSNDAHQAEHPGDTFFSQMKALSTGIRGIWFPVVPDFNPNEDYNVRFVAGETSSARAEVPGNPLDMPGVKVLGGTAVPSPQAASLLGPGR